MKIRTFALRNTKEILRDPLTLLFGLGFPVVILLILSAIQANIPVDLFVISNLAPGVAIFGLSFMTLFSAMLVARDRSSALLLRLYTTPMTPKDFILGYLLPILPLCIAQSIVCYGVSLFLGLKPTASLISATLGVLPAGLLFVSLGLLFGSLLTDKQVGGICGALLTNLTAWLSGIWFDLDLVGGAFKSVAHLLPFVHAVELERALLRGAYGEIAPHLLWVLGYALAASLAAVYAFLRQMRQQ